MKRMFKKLGRGKSKQSNEKGDNVSVSAASMSSLDSSFGYEMADKEVSKLPKFHKAAYLGDDRKVKDLAKRGPNVFDSSNRTPLHLACAQGHSSTVEILLSWKAKVNLGDNEGKTPIIKAVEGGSPECIQLLLESKADTNVTDAQGNTPLHVAATLDNPAIVKALCMGKAQTGIPNKAKKLPLHVAVSQKLVRTANMLIQCGADVNGVDEDKRTALSYASEAGDDRMVSMLLGNKANPKIASVKAWTPFDFASLRLHDNVKAQLEKAEAEFRGRKSSEALSASDGRSRGSRHPSASPRSEAGATGGGYGLPAQNKVYSSGESEAEEEEGVLSQAEGSGPLSLSWKSSEDESPRPKLTSGGAMRGVPGVSQKPMSAPGGPETGKKKLNLVQMMQSKGLSVPGAGATAATVGAGATGSSSSRKPAPQSDEESSEGSWSSDSDGKKDTKPASGASAGKVPSAVKPLASGTVATTQEKKKEEGEVESDESSWDSEKEADEKDNTGKSLGKNVPSPASTSATAAAAATTTSAAGKKALATGKSTGGGNSPWDSEADSEDESKSEEDDAVGTGNDFAGNNSLGKEPTEKEPIELDYKNSSKVTGVKSTSGTKPNLEKPVPEKRVNVDRAAAGAEVKPLNVSQAGAAAGMGQDAESSSSDDSEEEDEEDDSESWSPDAKSTKESKSPEVATKAKASATSKESPTKVMEQAATDQVMEQAATDQVVEQAATDPTQMTADQHKEWLSSLGLESDQNTDTETGGDNDHTSMDGEGSSVSLTKLSSLSSFSAPKGQKVSDAEEAGKPGSSAAAEDKGGAALRRSATYPKVLEDIREDKHESSQKNNKAQMYGDDDDEDKDSWGDSGDSSEDEASKADGAPTSPQTSKASINTDEPDILPPPSPVSKPELTSQAPIPTSRTYSVLPPGSDHDEPNTTNIKSGSDKAATTIPVNKQDEKSVRDTVAHEQPIQEVTTIKTATAAPNTHVSGVAPPHTASPKTDSGVTSPSLSDREDRWQAKLKELQREKEEELTKQRVELEERERKRQGEADQRAAAAVERQRTAEQAALAERMEKERIAEELRQNKESLERGKEQLDREKAATSRSDENLKKERLLLEKERAVSIEKERLMLEQERQRMEMEKDAEIARERTRMEREKTADMKRELERLEQKKRLELAAESEKMERSKSAELAHERNKMVSEVKALEEEFRERVRAEERVKAEVDRRRERKEEEERDKADVEREHMSEERVRGQQRALRDRMETSEREAAARRKQLEKELQHHKDSTGWAMNGDADLLEKQSAELDRRQLKAREEVLRLSGSLERKQQNSAGDQSWDSDNSENQPKSHSMKKEGGDGRHDDGLSDTDTDIDPEAFTTSAAMPSFRASPSLGGRKAGFDEKMESLMRRLAKEQADGKSKDSQLSNLQFDLRELKQQSEKFAEKNSELEELKINQENKIRALEFNIADESERRKDAEAVLKKTKEQLGRKEEQCTAEMTEKQRSDFNLRSTLTDLANMREQLRVLDEQKGELTRQLEREAQFRQTAEKEHREACNKLTERIAQEQMSLSNKDGPMAISPEILQLQASTDRIKAQHSEEIESLNAQIADLQKSAGKGKREVHLMEDALTQASMRFNVQLSATTQELHAARHQLEAEVAAKDKLEEKLQSTSTKLNSSNNELDKLNHSFSEAEKSLIEKKGDLETTLAQNQTELVVLSRERDDLSNRLQTALTRLSQLETEYREKMEALANLSMLKTEAEQKEEKLRRLEEDITKEREKSILTQTRYDMSEEGRKEQQEEIITLRQQVSLLQNASRDPTVAELVSSLRQENQTITSHMTETVNRLKEEVGRSEGRVQRLEQENKHIQQLLSEAERKLATSEANTLINKQTKESAERDCITLRSQVDLQRTQLESTRAQTAALEPRHRESLERLHQAQDQASMADRQLEAIRKELEVAIEEKNSLQEKLISLEFDKAEVTTKLGVERERTEACCAEIEELRIIKEELEKRIIQLRSNRSSLEGRLGDEALGRAAYEVEAEEAKGMLGLETKARYKMSQKLLALEKFKRDADSLMSNERLNMKTIEQQKENAEKALREERDRFHRLEKKFAVLKARYQEVAMRAGDDRVASHLERDMLDLERKGADLAVGGLNQDLQASAVEKQNLKAEIGHLRGEMSRLSGLEAEYKEWKNTEPSAQLHMKRDWELRAQDLVQQRDSIYRQKLQQMAALAEQERQEHRRMESDQEEALDDVRKKEKRLKDKLMEKERELSRVRERADRLAQEVERYKDLYNHEMQLKEAALREVEERIQDIRRLQTGGGNTSPRRPASAAPTYQHPHTAGGSSSLSELHKSAPPGQILSADLNRQLDNSIYRHLESARRFADPLTSAVKDGDYSTRLNLAGDNYSSTLRRSYMLS